MPAIDLSAPFEHKPIPVGRHTCIVFVALGRERARNATTCMVVVDAVNEAIEMPAALIDPRLSFGAKIRADFIAGMGKLTGTFVIILDVGKLCAVDEFGTPGDP